MVQSSNEVFERADVDLVETGQENATLGVLADRDRAAISGGHRIGKKQVAKLFVIDLDRKRQLTDSMTMQCRDLRYTST